MNDDQATQVIHRTRIYVPFKPYFAIPVYLLELFIDEKNENDKKKLYSYIDFSVGEI